MNKGRTEAFTDAIIAILMTILVLGIKTPDKATLSALWSLKEVFITYALSFFILGITWHNHHHMFQIAEKINGKVIWMNTLMLFFLSLFPFATNWLGQNPMAKVPEILYGVVFFTADFGYFLLQNALIKANGENSKIYNTLGKDKKVLTTLGINLLAIILGFIYPPLVFFVSVIILLIWFIPERRIERNY